MLHSLFVIISYAYFRLPESLAFSIDIKHHHRTKLSYHPTTNQESSSCRNRHHGMKSMSITTRFATLSEPESEVDFRINSIKPPTNPLADHTFAGQVEQAIIQKFGEESTQRVLESWRLLDMGYEHRQRIDDVSSNVDPDSSFSYQHGKILSQDAKGNQIIHSCWKHYQRLILPNLLPQKHTLMFQA